MNREDAQEKMARCLAVGDFEGAKVAYASAYSTSHGNWASNFQRLARTLAPRVAELKTHAGIEERDYTALDSDIAAEIAAIDGDIRGAQAIGDFKVVARLRKTKAELMKRAKRLGPGNVAQNRAALDTALGRRPRNPAIVARVDALVAGHASMLACFESKIPLSPRDHERLEAEVRWLREKCPTLVTVTGD
ncbi:hypothetical protein [Terricaulis sp.]|uniref:hypothetical protein n=1 Tax=Terricaulis sp. TaxID=2768686 RepID=UPI002AC7B0D7|nr:hypothetical protein [Terricaulis sp.]MDZ4693414.1 hypothetical protein [Terricaulis sp.]